MIQKEIYTFLEERYGPKFNKLQIDEVRVGPHLTAVRLSDDSYGVASTMKCEHHHGTRKERNFGEFSPNNIRGQYVTGLFATEKSTHIIDSLRMAVMNAISTRLIMEGNYKIIEDADPVEIIDSSPEKTVTIVGAFHSYIEKFSAAGNKLYVLELDKDAFRPESMKYYVPAEEYKTILPLSDIVIITGLTLVNNTIDGLLTALKPGSKVIVTGPSSSIIPDVLFEKNVDIVGSTRIYDPDLLFQIVSEGGSTYHLFRYCAKKICILND